jgi:putative NADPH-quinone reductase
MTRILQIDASPLGQNSISRKLTARVIERLKAASPQSVVSHRDLIATPVGHLGGELLQVLRPTPGNTPPHSATARGEAAQTEELLSEFLAADVIVIGAPMFNFSIPSQLKAWIDRVVQAGRTFRYTDKGLHGQRARRPCRCKKGHCRLIAWRHVRWHAVRGGNGSPGSVLAHGAQLYGHHRHKLCARGGPSHQPGETACSPCKRGARHCGPRPRVPKGRLNRCGVWQM